MSGRKGIHMPLHMAHFRPFLYFLHARSLGTSLSSPAICSFFTKPLNVASTQAASPEMDLKWSQELWQEEDSSLPRALDNAAAL